MSAANKKISTKQIDVELNKMDTKSAKIRYLNSLEMSRGDIARKLQIRYQHVRNVLITPIKKQK